jgi:hypothetical protein
MAKGFAPVGVWGARWAVAMLLAVAAAGCGSSSSSNSSPSAAAGSAASSASAAASSAASSASSSVSVQGGSASTFCASAKKAGLDLRKEIQGIAASVNSPPDKVKAEVNATLSTLKGIQSAAPSEIQQPIGVFVDYISQLQSTLAKHNYSIIGSVTDLQKLQANEGKLHAASAKLDAWGKANGCH